MYIAVRVVATGRLAGACRWLGHVADRGVALMACALLATQEPSSTPPVVPGAAPALAKAGVGGYLVGGDWNMAGLFFPYIENNNAN